MQHFLVKSIHGFVLTTTIFHDACVLPRTLRKIIHTSTHCLTQKIELIKFVSPDHQDSVSHQFPRRNGIKNGYKGHRGKLTVHGQSLLVIPKRGLLGEFLEVAAVARRTAISAPTAQLHRLLLGPTSPALSIIKKP